jgi:hypothetical protein
MSIIVAKSLRTSKAQEVALGEALGRVTSAAS